MSPFSFRNRTPNSHELQHHFQYNLLQEATARARAQTPVQPLTHDFRYKPLDESVDSIRLLKIEPAHLEDDRAVIRCALIYPAFLQKPVYEALSYTGAKSETSMMIYLNGKNLSVRRNLYDALCYLGGKK